MKYEIKYNGKHIALGKLSSRNYLTSINYETPRYKRIMFKAGTTTSIDSGNVWNIQLAELGIKYDNDWHTRFTFIAGDFGTPYSGQAVHALVDGNTAAKMCAKMPSQAAGGYCIFDLDTHRDIEGVSICTGDDTGRTSGNRNPRNYQFWVTENDTLTDPNSSEWKLIYDGHDGLPKADLTWTYFDVK